MKRYIISPWPQIFILLLILILTSEIAFLLIDKNSEKFIEMTYQAIIATISIVGAFLVTYEIEKNKNMEQVKKSEELVMRLLEDELQQNIDIYNSQYKSEALKDGELDVENMEQFILDKWVSIQISIIQIKDLFYNKDLYADILMLYSNLIRINYLIKSRKRLEAIEKKIVLKNIEQLIWKVFIMAREYNNEIYTWGKQVEV